MKCKSKDSQDHVEATNNEDAAHEVDATATTEQIAAEPEESGTESGVTLSESNLIEMPNGPF